MRFSALFFSLHFLLQERKVSTLTGNQTVERGGSLRERAPGQGRAGHPMQPGSMLGKFPVPEIGNDWLRVPGMALAVAPGLRAPDQTP